MRSIEYRGGVIRFSIPEQWKEEYESNGGGTFYEEGGETGILRLNVLTLAAPPGRRFENGLDVLLAQPIPKGARLNKVANGNGLLFSRCNSKESGQAIEIFSWQLAHTALPKKIYLAQFTWTVKASAQGLMDQSDEIAMIDTIISQAVFSPLLRLEQNER
ncbi:MAG: hypothetical protein JF616_09750 [Fibrobacteres bacterium]|jgi:hypothetical protein|nr:hypothetical protein [Fibrobacterota bacterium]